MMEPESAALLGKRKRSETAQSQTIEDSDSDHSDTSSDLDSDTSPSKKSHLLSQQKKKHVKKKREQRQIYSGKDKGGIKSRLLKTTIKQGRQKKRPRLTRCLKKDKELCGECSKPNCGVCSHCT